MLKKLLKYDLKFVFKPLFIFYGLFIFFSIVTRIFEHLNNTNPTMIIVVIDKICVGIVIALIFNIFINCLMRNWVRFSSNIYKDEAYLTHTLPVSKNELFLSKILTIIISLFISFVIVILGLAIVFLSKDMWSVIKTFLEQTSIMFNSSVLGFVSIMLFVVFFEFLFMIMCGILGIVIGHRANNYKLLKSIIMGIGIYFVFSIISLLVLYLIGLFNTDIASLFKGMDVSSRAIKGMMEIALIIYIIYNLIIYFVGCKLFNNGVNID